MSYELKIEDVSAIRRRLHFTVPPDQVAGEVELAFRALKHQVRLPGFRPGKVPRHLLEARFGNRVRGEVAGRLIENSYREAITDIAVAGRPEVEEREDIQRDTPFKFTIVVDVRPEVEVTGHKGVEIDVVATQVTDADVDRAVNQRLASQARIEEVTEDRPVGDGDFVLTELKLVDGEEELANEAGTLVNTAAERYYPGVESLLLGLKKDGTAEGEITIGESTVLEHLKGRTGKATVKVLGIQAHVVPQLDDETATTLGFEGAEDMSAKTREELTVQAEAMGQNQARVGVLQKLVESNEFEVPEGLVEEQLQALMDEVRQRQAMMGKDPRQVRFTDEEVADLRERAGFAARASCILAGVARQESLEATEADLDERIAGIAAMRGQTPEAIRGYLEREGGTAMLTARILEEKTLDWLLDNAKVTTVDASGSDSAPKAKKTAAKSSKKAAAKKSAKKATAKAATGAADWNKSMKKGELAEIAKANGLGVTSKMTKADIVALLEGA